ncbi:MAG: hypothetical protein RL653_4175 [Pseudomonadota bacterium]
MCLPMVRSFVPLLLLVFTACTDRFIPRDTRVTFDPTSRSEFWSLPFPSDLRREADGTFNLTRYPGPRSLISEAWLKTADARLKDGWGLTPGVFFTLSADVAPSSLPATAAESMAPGASVFLVDVDPASPERGRRFPLEVSFDAEGGATRPAHLLSLVQTFGFVRRPNTTYAAVITDGVRDTAGEPVGRSEAFHAAWTAQAGADAAAVENLEPLRAWMETEKLDPARVVGAAVFRTYDPNATLRRLVDWAATLPDPELASSFEVAEDYPTFRVVKARWRVPKIQSGERPGEGAIQWGEDGRPVQSGTQECRLVFGVPKRPMPAEGFPLMVYLHGSGGQAYEPIDRGPSTLDQPPPRPDAPKGTGPARYLSERGVAVLGFDFPLHGERRSPPDTSGLDFYSLFGTLDDTYNINQTIDNMTVAVMEVTYLTRLLGALRIPAALDPGFDAGGAADGMLKFDVSRLSAMGHSMGSTLGIVAATVDPRVQGWVFSGSGGMLIEVANSGSYPVVLKPVVQDFMSFPAGEEISRGHPLMHLFQHLWDHVDPVAKARHVALEPREGRGGRPFLQFAAITDGYFHPLAQQAVAVALGGQQVGAAVEKTLPAALALAGRAEASYPVQGNLPGGITGAVVPQAVPNDLGHYVVFDTPEAQSQYLCFAQTVGRAGGPVIVAPQPLDAPCP